MVRVLGKFLYTSTDVSFSNNIFSFSYCFEFIFMYTITILIYAVLLNPAVFFPSTKTSQSTRAAAPYFYKMNVYVIAIELRQFSFGMKLRPPPRRNSSFIKAKLIRKIDIGILYCGNSFPYLVYLPRATFSSPLT